MSWNDGGDGFTSLIKFCGRVRHFGGHRSLVSSLGGRDNPAVTLDNRESRCRPEKSGKITLDSVGRTNGRKIEAVLREAAVLIARVFLLLPLLFLCVTDPLRIGNKFKLAR